MRLNPNPRLEKLKDWRSSNIHITYYHMFGPGLRRWACNRRERTFRREWRDNRWELDRREDLTMTRFSHRHCALWDLT
jgi:hypothetical protein